MSKLRRKAVAVVFVRLLNSRSPEETLVTFVLRAEKVAAVFTVVFIRKIKVSKRRQELLSQLSGRPCKVSSYISKDTWDFEKFEQLGAKTKNWIMKNGVCENCNGKVKINSPHCKCRYLSSVLMKEKEYKNLWDHLRYERKRNNALAAAKKYKKQKKEAGGKFTEKDIREIYKIQNGKCYYCLSEIYYDGKKKNFHADHIKPLSKGGTNWPENIALACIDCNFKKSGLGAIAFWNKLEKIKNREIILMAKNEAKKQRPFKMEVSERRKNKNK